ncbi:DEAD/DEAH box helicase [Corallococcus exercitus]|uniref:DEAD/DEAH box helicase n=1 Tax=Corallococcus exercitus TaxID=2316736 RepID=UPI000EA06F17|nr:DEAD/DEAH box helicase family protein [Corallococcus exercitus]RKG82032.1 DEAD/DEAH box helicase [Corallococcus exercitus]
MVDFKKRLGKQLGAKSTDPFKIYSTLDRASDKGPLRPVQEAVLKEWHDSRRTDRNLILKLHTGQGKTLIGLLMLQSKLNEGKGPALYLCPNYFLVNQTVEQAAQFGIKVVTSPRKGGLPDEFLQGQAIYVTVPHKLFHGETQFGLGPKSSPVPTLLMDDAHACIDTIKNQCTIKLDREKNSTAYHEIQRLFEAELRDQGEGTFADLQNKAYSAYLPVPYWDWNEKANEVAQILSKSKDQNAIRYPWPLLRDNLRNCLCLISGSELVISPYLVPLDMFGSYSNAQHRIFMSATVTDDSFLIKGLGLDPATIENPLVDKNETWSGEKMILVPSLIHERLGRTEIVEAFGKPVVNRKHGVVVLSPSARKCADWEKYGSTITTLETIETAVESLKKKNYDKALVIVNRYDGIDLPDESCRVLIMDSKPFSEELLDRYVEDRRTGSDLVVSRTARVIEQGLGRAVRGEKDYCVIVLTGPDLVQILRSTSTRGFFSRQTQTQIEIGLEIADMAREEIEGGKKPIEAFFGIIGQCLSRDENWKEFYIEKMDRVHEAAIAPRKAILDVLQSELQAEQAFQDRNYDEAILVIQSIIDKYAKDDAERGWYLQTIARYYYARNKIEANKRQIAAHKRNRSLLKPKEGMEFSKLVPLPQKRVENVIEWIRALGSKEALKVKIEGILSRLSFGVEADRFEEALDDLARALGFNADRPDKDWKQGPDNLWVLRDNEYLLIECKNQVEVTRAEINKDETEQMNRSIAWFERHYSGASVKRIMIHPAKKGSSAAAFLSEVEIMRAQKLDKLLKNVRSFFQEFGNLDLKDISDLKVQQLLEVHHLSIEELASNYSEKPYMAPKT